LRHRILLQARGVIFHGHGVLLGAELHPPDAVNLAHAVDRPQLVFAGQSAIVKSHIQVGHAWNPLTEIEIKWFECPAQAGSDQYTLFYPDVTLSQDRANVRPHSHSEAYTAPS